MINTPTTNRGTPMHYSLTLVLLAAAFPALSGTFWHPEANGVVLAAPPGAVAEVCSMGTGTSIEDQWRCDYVATNGAKMPIYVDTGMTGPMRVKARWAYAETAGGLVPMAEFNE
jgi:hypothetical protein